jgi:hypothetical protein
MYITYNSKTSLIWTNWGRTLVKISESPNYRSATENVFREVIKWISRRFLGHTILCCRSQGSVVSIATGYRLDDQGVRV